MKNIYFIKLSYLSVFCLCCALFFGSCKKFLKEEPFTSFSADNYYDSPKKLNLAVLGIYEVFASRDLFGNNLVMLGGDTDIEIVRGNSVNGSGSLEEVAHYNANDRSGVIEAMWKQFYTVLNRANVVIDGADKMLANKDNDEKLVRKYLAEAKALRAFIYLNIVLNWGDAPLRIKPFDLSQQLFISRTPKEEVYTQILKDFEESIPDLPWHDAPDAELGRMNKGAAMALYARACLFAGGYSLYQDGQVKRLSNYLDYYRKAESMTATLINSGKHSLNPSYEQIFKNICGNIIEPKESLFEVDLANIFGDTKHAGTIGSTSTATGGKAKMNTHSYFYKKFDAADLRRDVSVATYGMGPAPTFKKTQIVINKSSTWTCGKWRTEWFTGTGDYSNLTDVNNLIIRYTEVLLMRAEILNEINNGPTPEAIELVNLVRDRAYGTTDRKISAVKPQYLTNKDTFLNFISEEYAREFYGEGNRKFALIRWNLLETRIKEMAAIFNDQTTQPMHGLKVYLAGQLFDPQTDGLLPIPYRDITESAGILIQNHGY